MRLPGHLRERCGCRAGYSLLEMLTVVALSGLLAAVAVPTFQSFRLGAALASAEEEVVAVLLRARWMAINSGATRTVDLASPTVVAIKNAGGTVLESIQLSNYFASQSGSVTSFTFDSRGFLSPASTVVITISNPLSGTRTVTINSIGKILKS